MRAPKKTKPSEAPKRATVNISIPGADVLRVDAFGEHMRKVGGVDPSKRGHLILMLARKGLDAFEAEAAS